MGEVLEVGEGVHHVEPGDRVIVPGTSECGRVLLLFDRQARSVLRDVRPQRHLAHTSPIATTVSRSSAAGNVGGYAEVMNVTANQVFPVETDLPDQWLSLLGCGITTGLGPRCSTSPRSAPGSSVAIVGCGHLGLWMVQAAKLARRRTIIALDPIAWPRELAGTLGATHFVDPSAEDPVAAVQALTGGRVAPTTCSRQRPGRIGADQGLAAGCAAGRQVVRRPASTAATPP